MKASRRRMLRWVLGILAVVVLVGAVLLANLAAQLSGGWDEVLDPSHPMPDDPQVVAARVVGGATLDAELVRVLNEVIVPNLADGRVAQPARTGAAGLTDRAIGIDSSCQVGSHDWKRDDPYDLLCTEIRRAIVAGQEESFGRDLRAVHRALAADGWQPRDEYSGLPPALGRAEADAVLAGAERPTIANVSQADYRSADGRFSLQLAFQSFDLYTGRPAPALTVGEYGAMVSMSHESYLE